MRNTYAQFISGVWHVPYVTDLQLDGCWKSDNWKPVFLVQPHQIKTSFFVTRRFRFCFPDLRGIITALFQCVLLCCSVLTARSISFLNMANSNWTRIREHLSRCVLTDGFPFLLLLLLLEREAHCDGFIKCIFRVMTSLLRKPYLFLTWCYIGAYLF